MNRKELESELACLGTESMRCERKCEGVKSPIEYGAYPRCAILSGSGDKVECVIISLAPPRTTTKKRKTHVDAGGNEERIQQYRRKVESTVFYSKLDEIRKKLGLEGSAVWTALCKCERIKGEVLPSKTVQTCAESHLAKELTLVDKSAVIIAVGNRAFNVVRENFPDRFVLNIPSPNGPRADFQETSNNKRLLEFAKARIAEGRSGALCLCPPCARKHLSTDQQPKTAVKTRDYQQLQRNLAYQNRQTPHQQTPIYSQHHLNL
jgi:hypothetical protein